MDEVGGPPKLVVKIAKEKLKAFESLWETNVGHQRGTTKAAYQRSKSEDVFGAGMKTPVEGEDEEKADRKRITHFKKRIIRTHSASAATPTTPTTPSPPLEQIPEYPRIGRHHLPPTTPTRPTAPSLRHRTFQEVSPLLPKSPEDIFKEANKIAHKDNPEADDIAHRDKPEAEETTVHKDKPEAADVHDFLERDFAKVLNNFYAILDTVRGTFEYSIEVIKVGVAEVELFLRTCDAFAKRNLVFDEHRVFYSFLDCMCDFTSRIRMHSCDGTRTVPLLTPVEESFYKNVFFKIFEYMTSQAEKNEPLSMINCIIWKQREVEPRNMIVLPLIGHSPCTPQCCHPPKKEEAVVTSNDKVIEPKKTAPVSAPSPSGAEVPAPSASPNADQVVPKTESKEEVQKEIQEMQAKRPKYKVSEILCIEIDSECDSSDDLEEAPPVKPEPTEAAETQQNQAVPEVPPKSPEVHRRTPNEGRNEMISQDQIAMVVQNRTEVLSEAPPKLLEVHRKISNEDRNEAISQDQIPSVVQNRTEVLPAAPPNLPEVHRKTPSEDRHSDTISQDQTPRIIRNTTKVVENHRPEADRSRTDDSRSKTMEDRAKTNERDSNLQGSKRLRTESSGDGNAVVRQQPAEKVRLLESEDNFRQQFPNTVITRRDGDIISDGRIVVLEKGKVSEPNRCRMPPPPYPASNGPASPAKPHQPPPPYPTNGVSQTIRQFANLSTKESLDPIEYVKEMQTLYKIPNIPDEFKSFYRYITKVQILHEHNPITFKLFLELLNQGGLKDYHVKFREYAARKFIPVKPCIAPKKRIFSKKR